MYVYRNIEAISCNYCCSWKAINITYSEYVFVAFFLSSMQERAPCCHLWPTPLYSIFPHDVINGKIAENKNLIENNVCYDFLYNFGMKHFSF